MDIYGIAWPTHPQATDNKTIPVADNGAELRLLVLSSLCSEASEGTSQQSLAMLLTKVFKRILRNKFYVK